MANIYLGPTTSGAPLPPIRWTGGSAPKFPHGQSKQVEKQVMLSGSWRYNMKSKHPLRWQLSWAMLTVGEFAVFQGLRALNQALWFQNNWEDATWRRVVIMDFEPDPVLNLGSTACRWNLSMSLEEAR